MGNFSSAFASARKAGKSVFTWNGKSYNTKLASGAKSAAPKKKKFAVTPEKGPIPADKPEQARKYMHQPTAAQIARKNNTIPSYGYAGLRQDQSLGAKEKEMVAKPNKAKAPSVPANIGGTIKKGVNNIRNMAEEKKVMTSKDVGSKKVDTFGKMKTGMDWEKAKGYK